MTMTGMYAQLVARFKDDGDASGALWSDALGAFFNYGLSLTDGVGSMQADVGSLIRYSIAGSGTQLIPINDTIVSVVSGTLTIAKVVAFGFRNNNTVALDACRIEADVSNGFLNLFTAAQDAIKSLGPQGIWWMANPIDGWACTSSSDELLVTNLSLNTLSLDFFVLGRSA